MAIITSGHLPRAVFPGVKAWVGMEYKDYALEFKEIFDTTKSDKEYEIDVTLGSLGYVPVRAEGENVSYDGFGQGFEKIYRHIEYALGFQITQRAIEDNQYMKLIENYSRQLGRSARITMETIAANVLNNATNAAKLGPDGVSLLSTAHKLEQGGTYANMPSSGQDLSEASLEAACTAIAGFTDGAGKPIAAMSRKLIVPKESAFEAKRILGSEKRVLTADNDLNALKELNMFPDGFVVNHYLTDPDSWFVKTDVLNGLKHYERVPFTVSQDSDFDSDNMKYKGRFRCSFAWTDPRAIYGSMGA